MVTSDMEVKCLVGCFNANGDATLIPVKVLCSFDSYNTGLYFLAVQSKVLENGYEWNDEGNVFIVDENEDVPSSVWECFDWNDCMVAQTTKQEGNMQTFYSISTALAVRRLGRFSTWGEAVTRDRQLQDETDYETLHVLNREKLLSFYSVIKQVLDLSETS